MRIEEARYKDLKFESKNEYLFWLKQTGKTLIQRKRYYMNKCRGGSSY